MKIALAFVGLFAVASASVAPILWPTTTLIRSPSDDSAIVTSQRIGGSFSYSTLEGHAYKAITPVVQNVITPVVRTVELRSALPYWAAGPQLIWQQPTLTLASPTLIATAPAVVASEPESRSDEPKQPEEPKEENSSDDTVTVESA